MVCIEIESLIGETLTHIDDGKDGDQMLLVVGSVNLTVTTLSL